MGLHFAVSVRTVNMLVLLLFWMSIACTSSKKSSSEAGEGAKIEQSDSLNINNPEMLQKNLAPGTAQVILKEMEISHLENGNVGIDAVLVKILGYGSATPPLSPGNKIRIDASEYFMNAEAEPDNYVSQDSLICLVSKQGSGPAPNSDSASWKLMNIYRK